MLIAGLVTGKAGGTISLAGSSSTANQIGTVGPLDGASVLVNDGGPLTVISTVDPGTTVTLNSAGLLSINGTVTAAAIALNGTAIAIDGLVTDGGAGTVNLNASSGSITERRYTHRRNAERDSRRFDRSPGRHGYRQRRRHVGNADRAGRIDRAERWFAVGGFVPVDRGHGRDPHRRQGH